MAYELYVLNTHYIRSYYIIALTIDVCEIPDKDLMKQKYIGVVRDLYNLSNIQKVHNVGVHKVNSITSAYNKLYSTLNDLFTQIYAECALSACFNYETLVERTNTLRKEIELVGANI